MTLAERFFKEELEVFENDDIQEFCIELLDTAPTYFWQVSASSTNKYHPDYTVGFMGLAKHVKDTYFVGIDKRDKHAYLLGFDTVGEVVFDSKKVALNKVHEAEKHKLNISDETDYEEY